MVYCAPGPLRMFRKLVFAIMIGTASSACCAATTPPILLNTSISARKTMTRDLELFLMVSSQRFAPAPLEKPLRMLQGALREVYLKIEFMPLQTSIELEW